MPMIPSPSEPSDLACSRRAFARLGVAAILASLAPVARTASASAGASEISVARERGLAWLAGMFDPELGLLPEYRGAKVHWLFHDNYLAAKVLEPARPDLALAIRGALARFGRAESGKIEIVFGEARDPLPFRRYRLDEVARVGEKIVKTEIVLPEPMKGWEEYADLRLLAALALAPTDRGAARVQLDAALATWDGTGFHDRAARDLKIYALYKVALALLAIRRLDARADAPFDALLRRLLVQQGPEGGWITDYVPERPVGLENVETTCLALLALEPFGGAEPAGA